MFMYMFTPCYAMLCNAMLSWDLICDALLCCVTVCYEFEFQFYSTSFHSTFHFVLVLIHFCSCPFLFHSSSFGFTSFHYIFSSICIFISCPCVSTHSISWYARSFHSICFSQFPSRLILFHFVSISFSLSFHAIDLDFHVHFISRACDRYFACSCTVIAIIIFIRNLSLPTWKRGGSNVP